MEITRQTNAASRFGPAEPATVLPDGSVELGCASCSWPALVTGRAVGFRCESCRDHNFILPCSRCGTASCVPSRHEYAPSRWECRWCLSSNSMPIIGCRPVRTALDIVRCHDARDVPAVPTITGFVVAASTIDGLRPGSWCGLQVYADGILLSLGDGMPLARLPFVSLDRFEIDGRGERRIRADTGRLARLATRPEADAVVRLGAGEERIVIRHPRRSLPQLRALLADGQNRWATDRDATHRSATTGVLATA